MLLFLLWIVEKVKSGEAKTRNVESFIFSYRFILYSFILLLFLFFSTYIHKPCHKNKS